MVRQVHVQMRLRGQCDAVLAVQVECVQNE